MKAFNSDIATYAVKRVEGLESGIKFTLGSKEKMLQTWREDIITSP